MKEMEKFIEKKSINRVSLIIIILIIIIKRLINLNESNEILIGYSIYNNEFWLNNINNIIIYLIIILSMIYIIYGTNRITGIYILEKKEKSVYRLNLFILISMLGIILLLLINDIMLLYIIIEYQSFVIYIITCIYKESSRGVTSSLYYFLIGSIGSLIILDGTVLLYSELSVMNINYIIILLSKSIISGVEYSFIIILLGLFWKLGLGPLYNYVIMIYTLVPTIITNYISLMPKLSIMYLILLILTIINMLSILNIKNINNIVYIILLTSMLIGSLGGLNEINLKKVLGYSGLLNISYIILTIVGGNNLSTRSYIFYIIQYSITHINIFSIILILPIYMYYNNIKVKGVLKKREYNILLNEYSPIEYINQLKNVYIKNKSIFLSLSISLFSLIGVPPLIGFYGKWLVLISIINSGLIYLSIILIIVSTISTVYYLSIIKVLTFSINEKRSLNLIYNNLINYNNKENIYMYINNVISLIISILTLCIILISVIIKKWIRGTNLMLTMFI